MFFLQTILNLFSSLILKKYKPKIIGITGSVGKTSAKEAIFSVLHKKFKVRRAIKNYNNELGVPLTIIGEESGGKNLLLWILIIIKACKLIFKRDKNYPEILILEMGADKPGDIKYLTKLYPCDVGILTAIAPAHLEKFKTIKKIAEEKQIIIKHLKPQGTGIINNDDELVVEVKNKTKAQMLSFGFKEGADLFAHDLKIIQEIEDGLLVLKGESFKLNYKGSVVPIQLSGVVGEQPIFAALVGAAVGISFGINLLEISESLKTIISPPSRMRILSGIKYTTLIDDSYNASPVSVISALDILKNIEVEPGARKIAVLGNMLELGNYTEEGHELVGKKVVESNVDLLITVGDKAKIIAQTAKVNGLSDEQIASFSNSEEAGLFVQDKLRIGDLVLIKGSQGVRMEKIVVELMAEPLKAEQLVCRQDKSWRNK